MRIELGLSDRHKLPKVREAYPGVPISLGLVSDVKPTTDEEWDGDYHMALENEKLETLLESLP